MITREPEAYIAWEWSANREGQIAQLHADNNKLRQNFELLERKAANLQRQITKLNTDIKAVRRRHELLERRLTLSLEPEESNGDYNISTILLRPQQVITVSSCENPDKTTHNSQAGHIENSKSLAVLELWRKAARLSSYTQVFQKI